MQHPEVEDVAWIYNGKDEVPPTVRRVRIAENIMRIPDEAFARHPELEEVILSSSVQVIGRQAFWSCKKLKRILYQGQEKEEVGIIGRQAFWSCKKLKRILYQGQEKEEVGIPSNVRVIDLMAFAECKLLKNLGLNEGLEEIGESAFRQCESLTEVNVPSTVKVICDHTFHGCISLARLGLNEGLRCIRSDAFNICQSLTEVEFPSTVKSIGSKMFWHCGLLARLGLNEGLRRIGHSAFFGCRVLTKVDFPSTVQVVDDCAFWYCTSLSRLGLNEGLQDIGARSFSCCHSLSNVRIPQSVNNIATDAFTNCSHLISIELPEERSFSIDLSGCLSLVGVVGTISSFFNPQDVHDRQRFFQQSKLGSLVVNEDILVVDGETLHHKLENRFDNSPLNKLCYFQSYHSWEDEMVQLHSLMEDGPPLAATTEVDEFGMTPLHVLSLAQIPNLDMLLAVMDAGKLGHMVRTKDSFGSTPMDYLCMNRMPNSTELIRSLFQTRYDQVLGVGRMWEPDILQAMDEALAVDLSSRMSEVGRVVRTFEWKEKKEIFSLLELYLWKVKIGEASSKKMTIGEATSKKEHRKSCRVTSGADFVIPLVLEFLDGVRRKKKKNSDHCR